MSKKSKRTESNLPRYSESPSFQRKTINSALFKNSESMQSNKKEERLKVKTRKFLKLNL